MIKAVLNRVIVKPEKKFQDKKTTSGLFILEDSSKNYEKGEIISVGAEVNLEVGKKVLYLKNSGIEIEYREERFLVLEIKEILAVIEEETHE